MEVHFTMTGADASEIRAKIEARQTTFAAAGSWSSERVVVTETNGGRWKARVHTCYFAPAAPGEEIF